MSHVPGHADDPRFSQGQAALDRFIFDILGEDYLQGESLTNLTYRARFILDERGDEEGVLLRQLLNSAGMTTLSRQLTGSPGRVGPVPAPGIRADYNAATSDLSGQDQVERLKRMSADEATELVARARLSAEQAPTKGEFDARMEKYDKLRKSLFDAHSSALQVSGGLTPSAARRRRALIPETSELSWSDPFDTGLRGVVLEREQGRRQAITDERQEEEREAAAAKAEKERPSEGRLLTEAQRRIEEAKLGLGDLTFFAPWIVPDDLGSSGNPLSTGLSDLASSLSGTIGGGPINITAQELGITGGGSIPVRRSPTKKMTAKERERLEEQMTRQGRITARAGQGVGSGQVSLSRFDEAFRRQSETVGELEAGAETMAVSPQALKNALVRMPEEQRVFIRALLQRAGLYEGPLRGPYMPGNDGQAIDALASALSAQQQAGVDTDLEGLLTSMVAAHDAEVDAAATEAASQAGTFDVQVSDPAGLRQVLQETARQVLGEKVPPEVEAEFIQFIQGSQREQQQPDPAAALLGGEPAGTPVEQARERATELVTSQESTAAPVVRESTSIDIGARAEEFLRTRFAGQAQSRGAATVFNDFLTLVASGGGTGGF